MQLDTNLPKEPQRTFYTYSKGMINMAYVTNVQRTRKDGKPALRFELARFGESQCSWVVVRFKNEADRDDTQAELNEYFAIQYPRIVKELNDRVARQLGGEETEKEREFTIGDDDDV